MLIKMKLKEALEIADKIDALKEKYKNDKNIDNSFMFALLRIKEDIDCDYDEIKEYLEFSEQYIEYENRRRKILLDNAIYSLDKKLIYENIETNELYFGDGKPHISKLLDELNQIYKVVIEEQIVRQNYVNEKLERETYINGVEIKLSTVPKQIDWETIEFLYEFITDDLNG